MSAVAVAAPMLETRRVTKRFIKHLDFAAKLVRRLGADIHEEIVQAVDSVDLVVRKGEVVGLVGESGCAVVTSPPTPSQLCAVPMGMCTRRSSATGRPLRKIPTTRRNWPAISS